MLPAAALRRQHTQQTTNGTPRSSPRPEQIGFGGFGTSQPSQQRATTVEEPLTGLSHDSFMAV